MELHLFLHDFLQVYIIEGLEELPLMERALLKLISKDSRVYRVSTELPFPDTAPLSPSALDISGIHETSILQTPCRHDKRQADQTDGVVQDLRDTDSSQTPSQPTERTGNSQTETATAGIGGQEGERHDRKNTEATDTDSSQTPSQPTERTGDSQTEIATSEKTTEIVEKEACQNTDTRSTTASQEESNDSNKSEETQGVMQKEDGFKEEKNSDSNKDEETQEVMQREDGCKEEENNENKKDGHTQGVEQKGGDGCKNSTMPGNPATQDERNDCRKLSDSSKDEKTKEVTQKGEDGCKNTTTPAKPATQDESNDDKNSCTNRNTAEQKEGDSKSTHTPSKIANEDSNHTKHTEARANTITVQVEKVDETLAEVVDGAPRYPARATVSSESEAYVERLFLAHVRLLINTRDELALTLACSMPGREITQQGFTDIRQEAQQKEMPMYQVMEKKYGCLCVLGCGREMCTYSEKYNVRYRGHG